VQPRSGFTGLPNELLALAFAVLTVQQFRLLVGLFYEAEFKPDGSTTPDGRCHIGFGQELDSYATLAVRYGMSVHQIERALDRFKALGVDARRASPAATPPATPGATSPATIQHRNTGTPNTYPLKLAARADASPLPVPVVKGTTAKTKRTDPRHHAVIALFCRLWRELRGGDDYVVNGRDGSALKQLLKSIPEADLAEVEKRIRCYLADPWCMKNGGLAHFCTRWSGLDGVNPRPPPTVQPKPDYSDPSLYQPVSFLRDQS
jgi:hypothetical protein